MSIGDFVILEQASFMGRGSRLYNINAGTTILAGEPVARALGATNVTPVQNGQGAVGTDYFVGIAGTSSTSTSTLAGTVDVMPLNNLTTWLVKPAVAATWNTQTKYNDLVGKRVTVNLTSGSYTVNATDATGNGLVVQPLDIAKYPGMVAVAFRAGLSDLS